MTEEPLPGLVDIQAWRAFCDLVSRGAGVGDHTDRAGAPQTAPSDRDRRYIETLVEHHRTNTVPFLLEHCGLAGKEVLELGSGTGGLCVAMVQAGVKAVDAVEPIPANHEAAVWRVKAYGLETQIRLSHVPDPQKLPFDDTSFDACVCCSVLQYVPDPVARNALLTEMVRVLRPGGVLAISGSGNGWIPGGPHSTAWWSNLRPRLAARLGHNRGVSYSELVSLLAPLGVAPWRPVGAKDGELERWHRRTTGRHATSVLQQAAHRLLYGLYWLSEATVCRAMGVPMGALMPYVALAFRKSS